MNPGRLLDDEWLLVPLALMACLELLRRTRPGFGVAAGTLVLALDQCTQGSLATLVMYTDLMYAAVLYGSPALARRLPVITGAATLTVMFGSLALIREPEAILLGVIAGFISFGPATTGMLVRNHREAAASERLRAEQTALLAEMDRVQAVNAERSRMARELHDMVANHLSAIAIHSTAALSLDDPRTTRDALGVIRENSVEGLAEMRRLIGLLRDSGGEREAHAEPTLDGLESLVEQARASGGPSGGLSFALYDERPADAPQLPAPVELAAYRIVQESLTNALKHAAPGEVTIRLSRTDTALRIVVTSRFGGRDGPRAPGSGAGLVGMGERATLLDGSFEALPVDTDDPAVKLWRVTAELPVEHRGGTA
ncbi:two-component sensor histidine kinase [Streptomyces triticagri]|uniref:histidine kinase n=2 Tax=Streptomyces triticagri TaxID=2293568 RepID=A0A372LXS7_9ACTN|nr:two-component sensor histidine kinase [Streptomyces triticagri]